MNKGERGKESPPRNHYPSLYDFYFEDNFGVDFCEDPFDSAWSAMISFPSYSTSNKRGREGERGIGEREKKKIKKEVEKVDRNYKWDAPVVRLKGKCVQYDDLNLEYDDYDEGFLFFFCFMIHFSILVQIIFLIFKF